MSGGNTLVAKVDLADFGDFDDAMVDVAAAEVRRDAGWHIAPRLTETITVESYGGQDIVLPTRSLLPGGPVVVTSVVGPSGQALGSWTLHPGCTLHRGGEWGGISGSHYANQYGWPVGYLAVTLTHGLPACPPDLLPVLAQRADSASTRREARVTSFTNGGVQMAFGDAYQIDPALSRYALFSGVS